MLQHMKNVLVVGPKQDYQSIIDVLYQEGTLHLQDVSGRFSQTESIFSPLESVSLDELSALLIRINGIYLILPKEQGNPLEQDRIYEELRFKPTSELVTIISKVITDLELRTRELAVNKSDLELSKTSLERYAAIIDKIQPLENQIPVLEGFEVTVLLIQREFKDILEPIRSVLKDITRSQFELITADIDERTIAAITVFNKKYSEQVHSFLFSQNVNEVNIPKEYSNMPLNDAITLITKKIDEINYEIADIDKDLSHLGSQFFQRLSVFKKLLEDREEEIRSYNKFGQSEHTIVIQGWVPKKFLKATRSALGNAFGERVVLIERECPAEEMEEAPIYYDNPRWVKPFEFFNRLVSPPRYREIDPVPFMAIFFPMFFGIMVGDIGYGICILGFALVMKKIFSRLEWMQQLMNIMIICSIPTIFFGYLYGEFFGDFGEMMGWIEPVTFLGVTWNRVEAMIPFLIFTIVIGVIHVFLGLGIGVIDAVYLKSRKHLFEKAGMIGVLTGIIILILVLIGVLPEFILIPALIVLLGSLPFLLYGGGIRGGIEVMGTVGNILSYARIMAIGMASVILAMVANELGGAVGVLAVGVIIAVLLHTLNVILAMFSPTIHSMRLHIVEFYSKFYEGGGELYHPFGKKKSQI